MDWLRGTGEHSFEQLWHLPADCHVSIEAGQAQLTISHKQFIITPLGIPKVETRVHKGEKRPMQGWVSPHYGQIEPAPAISFAGRSHLPVRLATALHLAPVLPTVDLSELGKIRDLLEKIEKEVNQ